MAASTWVKVKEEVKEKDVGSKGQHSHQFRVKFPYDNNVEYTVSCKQPCTVLEAIKLHLEKEFMRMKEKTNCTDQKLIIQLGKKGIVPTHFPCTCIMNDECLTIHCKTQEVEEARDQHDEILQRDKYSVFYISKDGGQNAKSKKLFRSNAVKEFSYLCVYAKKGTTVEEALQKDGRFNDLKDFKLSEEEDSKQHKCTQEVDNLDEKKFKICLYRQTNHANQKANSEQLGQQNQTSTSEKPKHKFNTNSMLNQAQPSGNSVRRVITETGDTKKMYELFPHLQEWIESDSFPETLELKKENFRKIKQSFSQTERLMKLLKLGESVCLVKIDAFKAIVQGTGFVLYDNFVLTNAHLFEVCMGLQKDKWPDHVKINVVFTFEKGEGESIKKEFKANMWGGVIPLDYAILELDVESQSSNQTTETEETKVPPGLLCKFGPSPKDGEACIIGFPGGNEKEIDPTCIITKENIKEAVGKNLEEYKDYIFTLYSVSQEIEKSSKDCVTYNTFMYYGASGSPVFDGFGRVFGLHTGGFFFGFVKPKESVIELALPLLAIFADFVGQLKKSGNNKQLERIQAEAKGNPYLEQELNRQLRD
ncbi:serine protease FAM111A-like isoform X2 [Amphiprion ocellaris]|uniref:serine protease FAM111A-like isoform X2 n=1 Tax=Amphiprion ocellaris TaxID=80972 RepID=UPI001649D848|nr:serine protease FAM111A-like isoform X2 [Amphiprion ocellaris]